MVASDGVQISGVGVSLVAANPLWLDGLFAAPGDLPSAVSDPETMAWVGTPGNVVIYYSNGTSWGPLQGAPGAQGPAGAAATIAVGTTTTLGAGASATVANVGTSAAAQFNFGIPTGSTGAPGVNAYGTPNSLSPTFGTAYQATDPTRPANLSCMIETVYTITVANTQTDTVELRIGPVQATVANGTAGTAIATYKNSLTGIALTVGLGTVNRNQLTGFLPTGWYFALRRVAGTTATIQGAFDLAVG